MHHGHPEGCLKRPRPGFEASGVRGKKTTRLEPPTPQTTSSRPPRPRATCRALPPLPRSARHLHKGSFPGPRHPQHQETHGELGSPGGLGLSRSHGRRHLPSATPTAPRRRPAGRRLAAFRAAIGRRIRPLCVESYDWWDEPASLHLGLRLAGISKPLKAAEIQKGF